MRTVIFDIDGVLADFIGGFTQVGHALFGTQRIVTDQQVRWDGFANMTPAEEKAVWKYIDENPAFWTSLNSLIVEGDWDRIARMAGREHVYFVTARHTARAKEQSERWLERYGVINPTVILSSDKGDIARAVRATHAIDDKAGNAIYTQYATRNKTASYLIDRPYNRYNADIVGSKVKRVYTVKEFLDAIG